MKKIYFLFLIVFFSSISAQVVNIPDSILKTKLITQSPSEYFAKDLAGNLTIIDTNNDGEIQYIEAQNISSLTLKDLAFTDITGIKDFINLKTLNIQQCFSNNILDVSNMLQLKNIYLSFVTINSINTQGCTSLEEFSYINNSGTINNLNFLQNSSLKKLTVNNSLYISSLSLLGYPLLEELDVRNSTNNNVNFTSLDLSNNINLKKIYIDKANLNTLVLNPLTYLKDFSLYKTKVTSIDLNLATSLQNIYFTDNSLLTNLNIQNCNNLKDIYLANSTLLNNINIASKPLLTTVVITNTGLTSLDFNGSIKISTMILKDNHLTSLHTSPITNLVSLNFKENLEFIDVSQNNLLHTLIFSSNTLKYLIVKNGNENLSLYPGSSSNNPLLNYICSDENKIQQFLTTFSNIGINNVQINSYCSFVPGGIYYTINGKTSLDTNNNGCDNNDPIVPQQKLNISNGSNIGNIISNETGNYTIPVQAGYHTITPLLENPSYFNVFPASITADFPTQTSPLNQNFCITANGVHNDLEVILIPINSAIPGFDAKYKIIYKNKGTSIQSGNISFNFNDNVMNYLSSNTTPSSINTGIINWSFTNLAPLQTNEITVTLSLNTPTQTPALNNGDILNYTVQVNGATDEMSSDNTFTLNQTVINSYDPNDKTCLQGASITQTQIGSYVHYLIRFENNGTANAHNIVVKDEIDLTKFDLSSLIVLDSSHNMVTKISNPNIVEFVFENIQLPFDDANNDGYLLFKIKTKSSLALGDTFSNKAGIYFDYNFPIITNNYTTTVQNILGTNETVQKQLDIEFYPNPVNDILFIKTPEKIIKIELFDLSGRIIASFGIENNKIDVSAIKSGNYIVKGYTKDAIFVQKMIKK